MGAQTNRLTETVLLSTHNIWFGWKIRKYFSVANSYLEALLLSIYAWNPSLNMCVQLPSEAISLFFGTRLYHTQDYIVRASSEGSGDTMRLRMLAYDIAAFNCDKCQHI